MTTITSIVVSGASNASMNGEYVRQPVTGYGSQATIFVMDGEWEGKAASYRIMEQSYQSGNVNTNVWAISISTLDNGWTLLYRNYLATNASSTLSPSRGWWPEECCESDVSIPPLIQWHGLGCVLDWRQDPQESLSDWTIEIAHEGTSTVDVYHVHRFALAKESHYFRSLFLAGTGECSLAESRAGVSSISLNPSLAWLFPYFLDYLYADGIDARNFFGRDYKYTALMYYFGDYFRVPRLVSELTVFWKEQMTLSNCHVFVESAFEVAATPLIESAIVLCSTNLMQFNESIVDALDKVVDDGFWLSVLLAVPMTGERSSKASDIIAQLCDVMDASMFHACTELLLVVSHRSAVVLLNRESEMVDYDSESALTRLQEMCINALATVFVGLDVTQEALQAQPACFVWKLVQTYQELARSNRSNRSSNW